jgi:ABC-type amino acid transport substrate-binding protein
LILGAVALAPPPAYGLDWDTIQKRGVLRVVTDDDPSMAFENELIDGFVKLHGLKLQRVTEKPLTQRIPTVLAGEADMALALFDTPERRQVVDFTAEVLPTVHTIATCRPQTAVVSTEELRTRLVGTMQGSVIEEAARRVGVPPANLVGFPGVTQVAEALCQGKVTAALIAVPDLVLLRKLFPALEYRVPFGDVRTAAWVVRKEDQKLKAALDAYLLGARRGGSWSRLVVKHWGPDVLKVLGRARGDVAAAN